MKEIELFIHTTKDAEPKPVTIGDESTVEELIAKIKAEDVAHGEPGAELHLFVETDEEAVPHGRRLCDCGIGHQHVLHCHHCRRIQVSVIYNGAEKQRSFAPSARIGRVLKWAVGAFGLTGADATEKELRLKDSPDQELPNDTPVGSLVRPHHCSVTLCLTALVLVQG